LVPRAVLFLTVRGFSKEPKTMNDASIERLALMFFPHLGKRHAMELVRDLLQNRNGS
jgi:hypothetical protein